MSAAVEGKLLSPLIVWNNTLVDGHNRYEIVQEHPEISFSTMPLPFESREEVLAWICKNQLGRRNLTPEQKKFLIGKQYSVEHRKPGGNGNNQHTTAAKKTAPEESSIRKQIAERNRLIMQTTKNRKFPLGNSLPYLSYVDFCRVRPGGRTLFLFHRGWVYIKPHHRNSLQVSSGTGSHHSLEVPSPGTSTAR